MQNWVAHSTITEMVMTCTRKTLQFTGKNLHNLLLTVPHGFLLVASLNYLAISEDEHKIQGFT